MMNKADKESAGRSFWWRLQWSPWAWLPMPLLYMALGRGSARSLAAGTAVGLIGFGFVSLTRWVYRRFGNRRSVRLLYAGGYVIFWALALQATRWMDRRPLEWMELVIQFIMGSVIMGPFLYNSDLSGRTEQKNTE